MLDPADVQAIVARSSKKALSTVLLFKLQSPGPAKAFLQSWMPNVISGSEAEAAGAPVIHFLFSWKGMELLLQRVQTLDTTEGRREFETFFVDPGQSPDSTAVAEQLGFVGDSAPQGWWERKFTSTDIDLAVLILVDTAEERSEILQRLRRSATEFGLEELELVSFPERALSGGRPIDGRLHFGYRDGISTIEIDWDDSGSAGVVNLREFFVGFPSGDYEVPPIKAGPWQDFARGGSFAGLTWIYQDVATFNKFLHENAAHVAPYAGAENAEEWLAAKLMGRWRDGSPIAKFPDRPPDPPALDQ